ncbi:Predicted DNA-binding transcriptional regulator YafY, contains an HTH and WYL domains [Paenibacillus sp. cl6col]|nr:Predicted DNA-binding transcriptional regulator YafY, contains an HTH and WYL domains [Paenibacillus sp. cl6col]
MSNMHRILWFDQEVRSNHFPNCTQLAHQFELSTRQANRDIEYMVNSLGAPLQYDAKKRGYRYTDATFALPSTYITEELRRTLAFLSHRYQDYNYGGYDEYQAKLPIMLQISELFRRLSDVNELQSQQIPAYEINAEIIDIANQLSMSIQNNQVLTIQYDGMEGAETYTFHPYKLCYKQYVDYVIGWCKQEEEQKMLRLDRIIRMERAAGISRLNGELPSTFGSSNLPVQPFTAIIEFIDKPSEAWRDYNLMKREDSVVFEIQFFDVSLFIDQLMSTREWARIVKPKWLKEKVKARCEQIMGMLSE